MLARYGVELEIFSGMPNPSWVLTNGEADSFVKQLAALSQTSARQLSSNLGYRGFVVQCAHGDNTQLISVQNCIVHISKLVTNVYAYDENRKLERWLLNTGRPHLKDELFQIAARALR